MHRAHAQWAEQRFLVMRVIHHPMILHRRVIHREILIIRPREMYARGQAARVVDEEIGEVKRVPRGAARGRR